MMTDSVLTALMSGFHWNGRMTGCVPGVFAGSSAVVWNGAVIVVASSVVETVPSAGARFAVGLSERVWLVLAMIRFLSYETVASSDSVSACLDPGVRQYERIVQGLSTVYDDPATA